MRLLARHYAQVIFMLQRNNVFNFNPE